LRIKMFSNAAFASMYFFVRPDGARNN